MTIPSNGNGPVQVNFAADIDPRANSSKELEASGAGGGWFKFTDDMNAGDSIGFGFNQESAGEGIRSSSATEYLHPAFSSRSNSNVLIHAEVMELKKTSLLISTAVLVAQSADGKHLVEQPLVPTYYSVNSNRTFDETIRQPDLFASTLELWEDERKGLFSTSSANVIGFMRIPQGEGANDLRSAHIELLFTNGFAALGDTKQPDEGHFLTIVSPKSALRYADTFLNATPWTSSFPYIIAPFGDWAIARDSNDADREAYIRKNLITVLMPIRRHTSAYIRKNLITVKGIEGVRVVDASIFPSIPECHPQGPVYTGTTKMSSDSDETGVTDSRLRVKGIKDVRVVDVSILPSIPECPQGPVYAIGGGGGGVVYQRRENN
ncbi:hypothetical protein K435DRAFT_870561 [Dendrothele bispora CBS 962.96]|uniref:Glucose-methanol-choline oxidoreductase C-terminal domain-containing protein n=1 Tax=Dendrothele bispora (strain CBS 962.96) TaxID=1314807 RepID=A0A4S8L6Q6_DENBC|nr:hypothetical protein K435DRAFT_870561 [Dendrothele bispora CBS 962.96]